MKLTYISIPWVPIPTTAVIQTMLTSPRKSNQKIMSNTRIFNRPFFWLSLLAAFFVFSLFTVTVVWRPDFDINCDSVLPVSEARIEYIKNPSIRPSLVNQQQGASFIINEQKTSIKREEPQKNHVLYLEDHTTAMPFLPVHSLPGNMSDSEKEFWKQPESLGFKPCVSFSSAYMTESKKIAESKKRYLLVIVSGGLNQQRNEIVDAVVIARILGAVLVVPILQVNQIWNDESEFSDIFEVDHFKRVLKDDVLVVSSLPSTHVMTRPMQESRTPLNATPQWIRRHYIKKLNREGVLLLRGLDGRLTKDLPADLQKLRCKVAFHALRFTPRIMDIGNRLAQRMWEKGPYVALHLRLEKDVWVRTGCQPGLGPEFDEEVREERLKHPQFLTARTNLSPEDRKLAGLCPLNAAEVTRLLKGLGAPKCTNIFWAGGKPLGGELALKPLIDEFGELYNKDKLALPGELEPFTNKASSLAAIDYLISLHGDVFMPSHGGNMAKALQGHRAYAGFRKHITPNKRQMITYFLDTSKAPGYEMDLVIKNLHNESWGQPVFRTAKIGRDVLAYPVPECMCSKSYNHQKSAVL